MDKIHIEKGSVQETLIIPLYGRKLCAEYFYLQLTGKTVFPKVMAFTNVLILFAVLKGVSLLLPVSAFHLGFTNKPISESMLLWFGAMLIWKVKEMGTEWA